ncbi:MAG: NAD-dependent epimerase/dehydratase family protein [Magnetococcales bacterium]|nr:NAD-dependent epimerase/dehydratase family protein [Magnetococcales bacterium]
MVTTAVNESKISLLTQDLAFIVEQVGEESWQDFRGGRLFLTGGTAFFGIWILASLQAANRAYGLGCQIEVLSRNPAPFLAQFPEFASDPFIQFTTGDVRYFTYPKGSFTHVIHGAVETRKEAPPLPVALLDVLINGTQRVLEFAGQSGVEKLLFLSSGAAYGTIKPSRNGVSEESASTLLPQDGNATLGIGKWTAEHLCHQFAAQRALQIKTARCFSFVGPFMPMKGNLAIGNFIADAVEGEAIHVKGDGTPIRSYLYVSDLMIWLWKILVHDQSGLPVNVGSDEPLSIQALATLTQQTLSPQKPIILASQPSNDAPRSFYAPDIRRAKETLGLKRYTSLQVGIAQTARWYRAWKSLTAAEASQDDTPQHKSVEKMTFVCDIDGVVARLTAGNDYAQSTPNTEMIQTINALYDAGHHIIMFTARGTMTGMDWEAVTRDQFKRWGLRYHTLKFGKPAGDYYVDDRMISVAAMSALSKGGL